MTHSIPPPWLGRVAQAIDSPGDLSLVVAVSGGGDSVGLLRVLLDLASVRDIRLSVAHLDHGARGEDSTADAQFVEDLAASLGLPFDLGHWRADRSGHFEADARRARYAWLAEVARGRGASVVAVGQTSDDQAETILHRIVRGTGIKGLSGIPASRPLAPGLTLVRPLLSVSRQEVRDYLASIGQDFREDASNLDPSRTRARIRQELLPRLALDYNPAVAEALVRLGHLASEATRALKRLGREEADRIALEVGPDRVVLDRPRLARLDRFERAEVLRRVWQDAGWPEGEMDARRWRRLASREDSGRWSVGLGVEAEATADHLILTRRGISPRTPVEPPRRLNIPGSVDWGAGRIVAGLEGEGSFDERVDLDRIVPPLVVRQAEPGDRFEPLGLAGGSQALNDFFRGRRVARGVRALVPIVADSVGILWVAGHRIADRVRRTEGTVRVLGLRWERSRSAVDGFPA